MLDTVDPVNGRPMTLMGNEPIAQVHGHLSQPDGLRRALFLLQKADLPEAAVWAGGFQYDGRFSFACYPRPTVLHEGDSPEPGVLTPPPIPVGRLSAVHPEWTCDRYSEKVRRAQAYIAAGDIYQVNLCQRFHARFVGHPLALHLAVRRIAQPRFAAFLPFDDRHVVCGSPELFLKIHQREITTVPIKGTRPRGSRPEEDQRLREELARSEKEQAELLMITDLERNDLGRVCEYGSVQVDHLAKIDEHPQMFHLSSQVRGRLREDVDPVSAIAACFPGGSITGAPKKRAMEIIQELERFDRRSFCGAFGFFSRQGAVFNIGIRLAEIAGETVTAYAGSGIVADSVPEAEYEESLLKAQHWQAAGEMLGRLATET